MVTPLWITSCTAAGGAQRRLAREGFLSLCKSNFMRKERQATAVRTIR